ncbi:hypothetical protein L3556_04825 [Candidatus Synechococcus calcipolaris G9]|uniref:Uncharacterized protein n=1 Tax=Candidatus Synechococcus calcipolaris G9 TaxID=1497997 RepID=A0ABT6EYE9_9SYNE|nr:hypothetical protein [Candidatus Synechococcus calcipolaris]MDG2990261.1 hypothetical protein [Candidatus Synechococcus calcipolaris G9]
MESVIPANTETRETEVKATPQRNQDQGDRRWGMARGTALGTVATGTFRGR